MGCINSRKKNPVTISRIDRKSEDKFVRMENKNVVTKKEDVVVRSSDFVIQHTQNSTFANHYTLDPHVRGEGAFGIVQKCFKKGTLEERAVKRIEKSKMNDQEKVRLQYEVNILKNLNHPNIVRLHEVFEE